MAKKPDYTQKTTTGWEVPIPVKDAFTHWCKSNRRIVMDEIAGAMELWTRMPEDVQSRAKREARGEKGAILEEFWDGFGEMLDFLLLQGMKQQQRDQQDEGQK